MNPNLRYVLAMNDEEAAAFDRLVKRAGLIGVGLPEGFPWDAETRAWLIANIRDIKDCADLPMAAHKAHEQIANWLEGIEDEND